MKKQIQSLMKKLDITEQEAKELIAEDNRIDKMTSIKQVNNDLTPKQQKAIKKYKNTSSHRVDAYGKKRTVERKPDETKRQLIRDLRTALEGSPGVNSIEVSNIERQINFKVDNRKFKVILSITREKKS